MTQRKARSSTPSCHAAEGCSVQNTTENLMLQPTVSWSKYVMEYGQHMPCDRLGAGDVWLPKDMAHTRPRLDRDHAIV
eukprot:scaffold256810_cov17-Tisochrysis_lutea.AAC.1